MGARTYGNIPESRLASEYSQRREFKDDGAASTIGQWPVPQHRRTYTVDEVAEILGISRDTAYEHVRRGTIPSLKFGRRIVVPKAALDNLLNTVGAQNGQAID